MGFLLVSSVIFAIVSLFNNAYINPLLMIGIFFVNAVGMVFIMASLGYMIMVMTIGKQITFPGFLSIYAFSSGVTLLAAWIPSFVIITEPWKWWLIWTGMTRACNFTKKQTIMIITLSIGVLILLFYSVLPLLPGAK